MSSEFVSFGKVPRLFSMPMVITEKIDGTNAQIYIEYAKLVAPEHFKYVLSDVHSDDDLVVIAGSRGRYITPSDDNFGFASFVKRNIQDLMILGPGRHFGEWWGQGIQRHYGLKEKKFSLFNTGKWSNNERPKCCDVVPVLYYDQFSQQKIEEVKFVLKKEGSKVAPGFMNPEGVVIFLPKANLLFKSTFEGDLPKGMMEEKDG